jgi:divalent metal cation (Fe/Co/Zn/Cd) transporter
MQAVPRQPEPRAGLERYRYAFWLAVFTVLYNLLEGLVSVAFGFQDESLALFGFGMDSFVEFLSGLGILVMVLRIWHNPDAPKSAFEQAALRVTGWAFYLLTAALGATAVYNIASGQKPETTFWGIAVSLVSLAVMWALIVAKLRVGRALNSSAIIADARCTQVCLYMSGVLLGSSLLYTLSGIGFLDSLGALGLAYFSFKEGREAFGKARGLECSCDEHG